MKMIPGSRRCCYVATATTFCVMVALIVCIAGCSYNPLPSQNLEIRTWYDLDAVRDNLAGNHTLMNDLDSTTAGYEELAGPMANGGKGWEPIGMGGIERIPAFRGTFDGQGYEIHDLFIKRPDEDYVGLFGYVTGSVANVSVANVTVNGQWYVGGLAGQSFFGTVSDCYASGSVAGYGYVGGLVGDNYGTMSNSYYTGHVTGNERVGGLMGQRSDGGIISNSYYNYDDVPINGENIITIGALFDEDFDEWLANDKSLDINERLFQESGYYVVNNFTDFKELLAFGQNSSLKFRLKNDLDLATEPNFCIPYLAGEFDGNGHRISNLSFDLNFVSTVGLFGCLASGGEVTNLGVENVNVTGAGFVGGLLGLCWNGTVSNCYATGSVSGNEDVGGLVGLGWGYVTNSYYSGNVTGDNYVGGLIGENSCNVSSSHSTGSVTGTQIVGGLVGDNGAATVSDSYSTSSVYGSDYVGGLVGWNTDFSAVSNCYASGSVTGNECGGLVGRSGTYKVAVSNSFWDTQASGQSTSAGGTGKSTAQMKSIATFSGAGWDITAVALNETNPAYIWNIIDNVTYPFLSWQS